jgi:hypothetical protein
MQDRVRDSEALLLLYLTRLDADVSTLPGGYRIVRETSTVQDLAVEKLAQNIPYEQLALFIRERETS